MKRIILIIALVAIFAAGTAFADEPERWGVGALYSYYPDAAGFFYNIGVTLKVPNVPVYWAAGFGVGNYDYWFGITGDYYFFDQPFNPENNNFRWYLGVGGEIHYYYYEYSYYQWPIGTQTLIVDEFNIGVRIPVGIRYFINNDIEIFFDIAPTIRFIDFYFQCPMAVGFRFWF